MANYGPSYTTGDITLVHSVSTGTTGWDLIDDDPNTGQPDGDYIFETIGATGTEESYFNFTDFPADFSAILTMTCESYVASNGTRSDDDIVYDVQMQSSGGTAYTDWLEIARWDAANDPADAGYKSQGMTINATGLAASKADWNGARVAVRTTYTKSKGLDSTELRIHGLEFNGTYDVSSGLGIPLAMHHYRQMGNG